jgi:chromosome segregation ATPase
MAHRTIAALACTLTLALGTSGCYTADIRKLNDGLRTAQAQHAELRREVEGLTWRVQALERTASQLTTHTRDAQAEVRAGSADIDALETAWDRFARAYAPEVRARLDTNLTDSAAALRELERRNEAGGEALGALRAAEAEAAALAKRTARHEAEARASNVVRELRAERQAMLAHAERAEVGAARAEGEAKRARASAESAAAQATAAGDAAATAEQQARDAASQAGYAAAEAEAATRVVGDLRRLDACVRGLAHTVQGIERRLCGAEGHLARLERRRCDCFRFHAGR